MCRACFAPAVYKLSCTTGETCSHVGITKGKDRSFFVYAFSNNEFEVSVSILCDRKISNRTCVWIELCQISAACFAMEHWYDLHGRFLIRNIGITTSRMTASVLAKAMRKFLEAQKNKSHQLPKGKQTLKELMKHNTGVSNLEITNDNIRAFSATAKKYGIDFALKKDSSTQPPRYLVFFKGRDADVMTAAFKEFSAKQLSQEKKPSIRKLLSSMKELAQKKDKVLDRTKHKDRGMEL